MKPTLQNALSIIHRAERDLGRLEDGQRRDFLMDNTAWDRDDIVRLVAEAKTKLKKNPRRKTRRARPGKRVTAPRKTYKAAKKHTRKATTKKRSRRWQHVYETARKEGFKEADAIKIANGVLKQFVERAKENPSPRSVKRSKNFGRREARGFIIEGVRMGPGRRIGFWYWTGHSFEDKRDHGLKYVSENTARDEAKRILPNLPSGFRLLRVVPA